MNANPDKPLMTQAQYARHRNTTAQYVGKLAKAGVLVMRGRLVDAVASDAVQDDKPAEKTTQMVSSRRPATRRPNWRHGSGRNCPRPRTSAASGPG